MKDHEKAQRYSYLDRLSTKQLESILRMDIESEEGCDEAVIFHILEVIERREREDPTGRLPGVDEAWEEFQRYYNTPDGEGLSLYPTEETEDVPAEEEGSAHHPKRSGVRRLLRFLAPAAIAACLIVYIVPPAMGHASIFEMIGRWTESTFHFTSAPYETVPPTPPTELERDDLRSEYSDLQSALDAFEVEEPLVPKWFPEGFVCKTATATTYSEFGVTEFAALYSDEEGHMASIIIVKGQAPQSRAYEKDESAVEVYELEGNFHYIFENNGRYTVSWHTGALESSISTDLSLGHVKKIIDSIYER